ncbi:MAG: hypothetical protein V4760_19480 [Bdellovibrionota bacterium]
MTQRKPTAWLLALTLVSLVSCAPSADSDKPVPPPPPTVPVEADEQPVKQEASCEAIIGLSKGQLIAPTEALRRGRSFLVRTFATFVGATAPDGSRRYFGIKGTLHPTVPNLDASSAVYTAVCMDGPIKEPTGSIVVRSIVPRPEIRLFNTNEYQSFHALAPEAIWNDGTLDGSLIPALEWNLGTGWRVTMTASREAVRSDLFSFKRFLDRPVFGGTGSLETYRGIEAGTFVLIYTIDARVNGKPIKVRSELEYVAL